MTEPEYVDVDFTSLPGTRYKGTELLDACGVAGWLGVSRAWVLAHANGNRRPLLPSVKIGKLVRFQRDAVEKFIQECSR